MGLIEPGVRELAAGVALIVQVELGSRDGLQSNAVAAQLLHLGQAVAHLFYKT
jgi:hypothetical protein